MLIPTLNPAAWPITRAAAFAQLSLDLLHDAHHNELVDRLIAGACATVGQAADLVLAPTEFEQRLDSWPALEVELAAGPVREVTAIRHLDADGQLQTVDPAAWDWEPTRLGGMAWLLSSYSPPRLADRPGAVRISFTAGFDAPGAPNADPRLAIPSQAIEAALLCVAAWFAERETGEIPAGAAALIRQIRAFR